MPGPERFDPPEPHRLTAAEHLNFAEAVLIAADEAQAETKNDRERELAALLYQKAHTHIALAQAQIALARQ